MTGKGGVGKTTISALLARALQKSGRVVLAIDADPNTTLLACMGHTPATPVPPLVELKGLIAERTGVAPGTSGGLFKINPRVEDIPGKYAVDVDGIKVLVAGAIKHGGTGCYCPENAFVRALVSHVLLGKENALILDMEAGIEHLSRGTVEDVDRLLIVVEPSRSSIETAKRINQLAGELGLHHISVIGNRIRNDAEKDFLREALSEIEFAGFVPYDEKLQQAELAGQPAAGASQTVDDVIARIVRRIEQNTHSHDHSNGHSHAHGNGHSHDHGNDHTHDHGNGHSHSHPHQH